MRPHNRLKCPTRNAYAGDAKPAGVRPAMSSRAEPKGASRRAVLFPAAASLAAGALPLPALAQQRPPAGGRNAARGAAPPPGAPATTPLGPVDTIARQAL